MISLKAAVYLALRSLSLGAGDNMQLLLGFLITKPLCGLGLLKYVAKPFKVMMDPVGA